MNYRSSTKFVAFCTKGLERCCQEELLSRCNGVTILERGPKRIIFETRAELYEILKLRTVEDVCVLFDRGRIELSLDALTSKLSQFDYRTMIDAISRWRAVLPGEFSVTVTAKGWRGVASTRVLQESIALCLSRCLGLTYLRFDHSNFDIRVFLDSDYFCIGVRIARRSLHHRSYNPHPRLGALRPTVAACMVRLACQGNQRIVDNFCGSGIILCEALAHGALVYGGDVDRSTIAIAMENLHRASKAEGSGPDCKGNIKPLDATRSPWPDGAFDCAVSNLPWDKQCTAPERTTLYKKAVAEYGRIIRSGGRVCLLVDDPKPIIKHSKSWFHEDTVRTVRIGLTGQTPTIVLMTKR